MAEQFYSKENKEALEQEISNYSDWIYEAERNDDLIFAPHAIDSPFQVVHPLFKPYKGILKNNWFFWYLLVSTFSLLMQWNTNIFLSFIFVAKDQ